MSIGLLKDNIKLRDCRQRNSFFKWIEKGRNKIKKGKERETKGKKGKERERKGKKERERERKGKKMNGDGPK